MATAVIALWSGRLFITKPKTSLFWRFKTFIKFEIYSVWLLYEVFLANLHVIFVACHPRIEDHIDPTMVSFETNLPEMAQFILAQSITLTPGTVTVRAQHGQFLVHALTQKTAAGVPGLMEDKIKKVFSQ